jgi:protein TonB
MDWEKYNFKEVFSFRIRIALLLILVVLILGFFFSPEIEMKPREEDPPTPPPVPYVPYDDVVRVNELPKNRIDDVLDNKISEDDKQIENESDVPEDLPFENDKVADVSLGEYIFIAYDKAPEPLNLDEVNFEYPESMRILGITGKVYLQLLIDKKGNVLNVVKMNSLHPVLDKVAVEGAWKLKFSPALQREKPVMVWYAFPVKFKLE